MFYSKLIRLWGQIRHVHTLYFSMHIIKFYANEQIYRDMNEVINRFSGKSFLWLHRPWQLFNFEKHTVVTGQSGRMWWPGSGPGSAPPPGHRGPILKAAGKLEFDRDPRRTSIITMHTCSPGACLGNSSKDNPKRPSRWRFCTHQNAGNIIFESSRVGF